MEGDFQQYKNKRVILFLTQEKYRLARHLIFLMGFWMFLFCGRVLGEYSPYEKIPLLLTVYFVFISMFYINMYLLVPMFFMRANYLYYLFWLVCLVFVGLCLMAYVGSMYISSEHIPRQQHPMRDFYDGAFITILIILVTTMVKLFQRWTRDMERMSAFRTHALNLELNVLKNQINPHFLFNMLNNVKALIRTNPDMAGSVIMKLSDFLRYQLYGNNEDKVLLASEIDFLSNFLNLEKIRRDHLAVSISIDQRSERANDKNIFVPPNLFTTFVENAVKHSVDIHGEDSYINILVKIEDERLSFSCCNSMSLGYTVSDTKNSGLGLNNIKRRLELLYKNRHALKVTKGDTMFTVCLEIPL